MKYSDYIKKVTCYRNKLWSFYIFCQFASECQHVFRFQHHHPLRLWMGKCADKGTKKDKRENMMEEQEEMKQEEK
jgi:hypothetical protein